MISVFDIRMKYKRETGYHATRQMLSPFSGHSLEGDLTTNYTEWLETDPVIFRMMFKRDAGLDATYWHEKYRRMIYTKKYRLWLEEQKCMFYDILEYEFNK